MIMDYSKGDEGMDEIFPIKVDLKCQKTKCENRRLSLPVIEDTKTFGVRGFTCRKSQPIEQTSNSTAKNLAMGQGVVSAQDLEANPTRPMYSDRRSTSMPEFYGLTEFRAKHEKKEASKNKLRRTKTKSDKHLKDETPTGLPALTGSSLPKFDSRNKILHKEDKEEQMNTYQPRRKTYLPRINPNTKPSLVRGKNSEISENRFNPDGLF